MPQAKILVTESEMEAYRREAARYKVPVSVWAIQVLREAADMECMAPMKSKNKAIDVSDEYLNKQLKIGIHLEVWHATHEALWCEDDNWSEWVRKALRKKANVR